MPKAASCVRMRAMPVRLFGENFNRAPRRLYGRAQTAINRLGKESFIDMEMTELPQDPAILMSYINTLLRDSYPSLGALCEDMGIDQASIEARLGAAGFEYNAQLNKFW